MTDQKIDGGKRTWIIASTCAGAIGAGFTATADISRSDFGVSYNAAIEGGGVVVSDKVTIQLEIEAVLKA